ncbi:hypothetical protein AX774_g3745 [Zancudomyces culisetae]|uniref:Uncharacterized protein n=1 Tax=Zancudomyces culisetae TaxID=1213189 RepID=A0A1R1PP64_ZANCU|nr:hypothetical protein AX774_g3745 [Zancudomyces culisetae]|eukprot:OMH82776.1 hypothetical protein AX774_g3745 [Zancudomyces culisetae]
MIPEKNIPENKERRTNGRALSRSTKSAHPFYNDQHVSLPLGGKGYPTRFLSGLEQPNLLCYFLQHAVRYLHRVN